jgi:hypothetical protein
MADIQESLKDKVEKYKIYLYITNLIFYSNLVNLNKLGLFILFDL